MFGVRQLSLMAAVDMAQTFSMESQADNVSHDKPRAMASPASVKSIEFKANSQQNMQTDMAILASRSKPLELLDMPEDILQAILREITHTNDLTALALTHSTLHDLVIPHVYSRFDIVWPEANTHVESRIGVDALTYGLATLVMASDVFGETAHRPRANPQRDPRKIRRGNHFAQYTKKFSLGNGPADWVSEYLINKEGGKMLGTLVALAVGRMRNLETFVWDMPTGVLRDVWLALASLANRADGKDCRLEKIWVRWHENTDNGSPLATPPAPGQPFPPSVPMITIGNAPSLFQIPAYPRVEFPTFSILPPLKSLTVLDIDERSYVEEMAVLIENSLHMMKELRVGVAEHAQYDEWTMPMEERGQFLRPFDALDKSFQHRGGILGILIHRFCNLAPKTDGPHAKDGPSSKPLSQITELPVADAKETQEFNSLNRMMAEQHLDDTETPTTQVPKHRDRVTNPVSPSSDQAQERTARRMRVDSIDLERVYLSVPAMSCGINWMILESITLLGCRNHEQLWKELRREYAPPSRLRSASSVSASKTGVLSPRPTPSAVPRKEYRLNLKKIHTDTVSHALIAFIKDALAPDSVEWLFFQDNSVSKSSVTIETIYSGAIRRHRGSLKKLLIDSEGRRDDEPGPASWKRWVLTRELMSVITSGKMKLRELSVALDYKDWHYFLQRLPQLNTLRSLHISHIADHVHSTFDSREAALQVMDIVSLRPDLQLCYLGVQRQCFEIIEVPKGPRGVSPTRLTVMNPSPEPDSDDDNDDTVEEEADDNSELDVDVSQGEDSEDEETDFTDPTGFRLREILFYDDKVSIFRARHGRL